MLQFTGHECGVMWELKTIVLVLSYTALDEEKWKNKVATATVTNEKWRINIHTDIYEVRASRNGVFVRHWRTLSQFNVENIWKNIPYWCLIFENDDFHDDDDKVGKRRYVFSMDHCHHISPRLPSRVHVKTL